MTWQVDSTQILSPREIETVLDSATGQPRIVFRLGCTGLRASEIADLAPRDVHTGIDHPFIQVIRGKGGKNRRVPLWWDKNSHDELANWKQMTVGLRFFVASRNGNRLDRWAIRRRFLKACECLGPDRLETLTVHHARHTFISYAIDAGRSLAAVRDAAGHSSLQTTSIYAHLTADDGEMGTLYGAKK